MGDNTTVEVDTMSQKEDFRYLKNDDFAVARLPYGRDMVAMYVFLPDLGMNVDELVKDMSPQDMDRYINSMGLERDLKVRLPKFKVEYGTKRLNDALTSMGMGVAFDSVQADFSGIAPTSSGNLFISFVDHKALIEVTKREPRQQLQQWSV